MLAMDSTYLISSVVGSLLLQRRGKNNIRATELKYGASEGRLDEIAEKIERKSEAQLQQNREFDLL